MTVQKTMKADESGLILWKRCHLQPLAALGVPIPNQAGGAHNHHALRNGVAQQLVSALEQRP